jgi:hypothetical protein
LSASPDTKREENPYRLWTYKQVLEATTISRRTLQRLIDRGIVKVSATCRGRIPDPEVRKLLAVKPCEDAADVLLAGNHGSSFQDGSER